MRNKILFSLLTLSLLLSYLKFEYLDGSYPGDFKPPKEADYRSENINEGPWRKRISFALSSDDRTFLKNPTIISDQANVPDAILFQDSIYVYYMAGTAGEQENIIALAKTEDEGESWIYHYVTIDGFSEPVGDPDVLLLEGGTIRMYFTAHSSQAEATAIHVASSTDGTHFTYLGEAFVDPTGENSYVDSMTYQDKEGNWQMYTLQENEEELLVIHATSTDGLSFTRQEDVLLRAEGKICVPGDTYWGEDGNLYMLATELGGAIRLFVEEDGAWIAGEKRLTVTEDYESREVRDPTVLRLPDGRLFMVYSTFIPE